MLSFKKFEDYLKENQKAALPYVGLLRGETVGVKVITRHMDADGTLSDPEHSTIMVRFTGDTPPTIATSLTLEALTRRKWKSALAFLAVKYPPLAITGLSSARKIMERRRGASVTYEASSGYISSMAKQLEDFRNSEAEAGRWHPFKGHEEPEKPVIRAAMPVVMAVSMAVPVAALPLQPPKSKKQKMATERSDLLYAPPSAVHQLARYAGMNVQLKKYLKHRKVWSQASKEHWKAIADWTKTTEGRAYLSDAGLDPEGFNLDHVHDKNKTPIWHA